MQSAVSLESGTIRFGMFGAARLYAGAQIVADVLERYPGVRVELIGQHSNEVQEQLRRGHLEAAMIAATSVESEGMTVIPVARDEIVYISADPERLTSPVTRGAAREGVADHAGDDVALQRLRPHRRCAASCTRPATTRRPGSRSRRRRRPSTSSAAGSATRSSRAPPPSSSSPGSRRTSAGSRCAPSSTT